MQLAAWQPGPIQCVRSAEAEAEPYVAVSPLREGELLREDRLALRQEGDLRRDRGRPRRGVCRQTGEPGAPAPPAPPMINQ